MSYRLTPLAAALALVFLAPACSYAQTSDASSQAGADAQLPEVAVTADQDAPNGTGKTYAGGKITTGGKLGVLGQQDGMDVPFNVVSYGAEAIQNQQARTVGEALAADPTVRTGMGYGTFAELFTIRGFTLTGDSVSYNGLYGIAPRQLVATESLDRVELLRGSSAFLNGVSPDGSGLGGSINLVPKRATDTPINQVTFDYTGKSRLGTSVDLGRRFGPDNQLGIRINALTREGEGSIDQENRNTRMLSIGSDLKTGKLRLSADFTYQKDTITQGRNSVYTSSATAVPATPSASSNWSQPWANQLLENTFGVLRGEYDVSSQLMVYATAGFHHSNEYGTSASPSVTNDGSGSVNAMRTSNKQDNMSAETGARFKFQTGSIKHQATLAFSAMQQSTYSGYDYDLTGYATSLYGTTSVAQPSMGYSGYAGGSSLLDSGLTARNTFRSTALSDTLSLLDDRLLLTVGLRHQDVLTKSYGSSDGVLSSRYSQSANSPVLGVVVKPWRNVALYANHIEGLSAGDTASATYNSATVTNSGSSTSPYKTKQNEVGVKLDGGRIGGGIALFEINKPTSSYELNSDGSYTFGAAGEQTNRGVELTMYGDPLQSVHLTGGYSFVDAKLNRTQSGSNDGNYAPGTSRNLFNLAADWDVPGVENLTLSSAYIYTAKQYVNAANTMSIPAWSRVDIGARYRFHTQGQLITLRAGIENVGNKAYWVASSQYGNTLNLGNPRTFKLSASVDF